MKKIIPRRRPAVRRLAALALAAAAMAGATGAHARQAMPEGMKGWWYFIRAGEAPGYAADPVTACTNTAMNHMRKPLAAMRPSRYFELGFDCKYSNIVTATGPQWYGVTMLDCQSGYVPRAPGVCVRRAEAPAPLSCPTTKPGAPGASLGNPVQLASGAKVQSETDLVAGPGLLRVERTYRSLRKGWKAQSAGPGWSFSFDRDFVVDRGFYGTGKPSVSGTLGDGSFFQFDMQANGSLRSRHDKRLALQAQGSDYNDWILTTTEGRLERYTRVGGAFRLVSSHTRDGKTLHYAYDSDNRLTQITDRSGRSVTIGWSDGRVAALDGPHGGVRYEYEQAAVPGQAEIAGMGRLVGVHFHDAAGALLASRRYHYEDERQRYLLTGVTDENGARFATYAYNDAGQAVLSEHAGGAGRHAFAYPEEATRIVTDPLGTERSFGIAYASDGRGRISGESQPAGAGCSAGARALTYDADGSLASSTDFNGRKTCFVNDPARGLETSRVTGLAAGAACPASGTAPIGAAVRRASTEWHPDWALVTRVAEANAITTYLYNGQRDAGGAVVQCAVGGTLPGGKPLAVLCRKTVQPTSDANGVHGFAAQAAGAARAWHYSYDGAGRLLAASGPAAAGGTPETTSHTYYDDTTDSHTAGDLASTSNGAREVTGFLEYASDGKATRIRRPDGQMVSLLYEPGPRRRLLASTVDDGSGMSERREYAYDAAGQLTRAVAPDGSAVSLAYDGAHRLTDLVDSAGNAIHLVLDSMGNVVRQEVRGPGGELAAQASRAFDALNRPMAEQGGAGDAGTAFQYDRGGNLTALTDPLGRVTTLEHDNFNRVVREALPPAQAGTPAPVIGTAWNHQDLVVGVTDPRGLATRYSVDGLGQRTTVTSPDSGTTASTFDGAGNLAARVDARGQATTYRFDAAQRVTRIGASSFEYGAPGTSAAGRVATMRDDSGQTSYAYNGFGRLHTRIQSVGAGSAARGFRLSYGYGTEGAGTGHVTAMIYPSGHRIDIGYGADGRPASLALAAPGPGAPVRILGDIAYLPFGAARGWTWGNSTPARPNTYARKFDLGGRLAGYPLGAPGTGGVVRTLHYDSAGRITASTHAGHPAAPALDQRYDYDGLDRLTGFDAAGASQRFSYDASGNRTGATFGAAAYASTIDAASNRLLRTGGPAPARRNTYDAAGNLTSDGTVSYSYGADGRMDGVTGHGPKTGYRYNGLGQRVAKTGPAGVLVHYVYDEQGRLLGEYDRDGRAIQETVYLGDLPVAVIRRSAPRRAQAPGRSWDLHYVYADHLNTPRVLTRSVDNRIVWRWDNADPFGMSQPDENPDKLGVFTYNPRFPGQVYDRETNNHYNYFRDYDPQQGRYLQSDPIGLAGGINTYGYVEGNPISKVDPTGEVAFLIPFIPAATAFVKATLFIGSATAVAYGVHKVTQSSDSSNAGGQIPPLPVPVDPWTGTNTESRVDAFCPPDGPDCSALRRINIAACTAANPLGGGIVSAGARLICIQLANWSYSQCKKRKGGQMSDPD